MKTANSQAFPSGAAISGPTGFGSLSPGDLVLRYQDVRQFTEHLCSPLLPEDCALQSMPEASPARWHLAHTSWFFETFLLKPCVPQYEVLNGQYA